MVIEDCGQLDLSADTVDSAPSQLQAASPQPPLVEVATASPPKKQPMHETELVDEAEGLVLEEQADEAALVEEEEEGPVLEEQVDESVLLEEQQERPVHKAGRLRDFG